MEEWYLESVATRPDPHPDSPYDWRDEKRTRRFTLRLGRVNLTESEVEWNKLTRITCLRLKGENVSDYTTPLSNKNMYVICGRKQKDRVLTAVRNLYSKHCRSEKSEF